jgi:hypothetical protein
LAESAGPDQIDFAKQILPILSDKCFVCHGPDPHPETDFRLDSAAAASADLGGYRAIDPDQPAESEILVRIDSVDSPMPPEDAEKQLSDAERELIRRWIQQGGRYAQHWAFVPPRKHEAFAGTSGAIDDLITRQLAAHQTDFAAAADKPTLARRVALVLTGLPLEPVALEQFLADPAADAYENLVDRLLADPRFGEHQARYWLDAVRYGDTHGLHLDNRRGIYPYRDWVVRALNQNLPFDEFIHWQLAGDLLPEPSLEQLVATGYVRLNPSTGEGGAIADEFQMKNNFDRVETFGTVFLGMSLTCARCHTHKYDPIEQTEYYKLLAFFNSTAEPALDGNSYTYGPTVKVPATQQSWQQWSRSIDEAQLLWQQILIQRPELDDSPLPATRPVGEPSAEILNSLRSIIDGQGSVDPELRQRAQQIVETIETLESEFTTSLIAQELPAPRTTHVLRRGEYDLPVGDPLLPGVLAVMNPFPRDAPRNRLGLAHWLTSPDHPLVARVLVNRLWQQVFGVGLVRTPEEFGVQGQQPTHPELLDWLAVEFRESGWNAKQLIRGMVTSRTFRQSSAWRPELNDPENRLFARASSYRLDAEMLRDIGLWSSELLAAEMGGEGVKPYQPAGMWEALAHPASNTKQYQADSGQPLYRRSLYVYWKRTSPHPMMTLFDAPDRESSCVRRSRTNTPLQSLGMLNETQRVEMGRCLAERLIRFSDESDSRIQLLFQLLTHRPASDIERDACLGLLAQAQQRYAQSPADADSFLAIGEAARDRAIDPIEHAAWTQLAMTVLASDIAILLY